MASGAFIGGVDGAGANVLTNLRSLGHHVYCVASGESLDELQPDFAIVARSEVANELHCLRAMRGVCPVLVVLGASDDHLAVRALHAGASDVLHWPSPPDLLRVRIDNAMRAAVVTSAADLARQELSELAHRFGREMRATLAQVSTLSDALQKQTTANLSAETMRALQQLDRSTAGSLSLLSSLVEYADADRVGEGQDLSLETLVREVVEQMEREGAQLDLHMGALPRVVAPPQSLSRVLSQVLDNACRYARPSVPVQVRIRGERHVAAGYCALEIEDNGTGFDPTLTEEAFEPLRRLVGKQHSRGSGCGLAVARRLTQALGGVIGAQSVPGRGTTIRMKLPLANSELLREPASA